MAILIRANGTEERVRPVGSAWTLPELQKLVDGYIETASWENWGIDTTFIFNEEGRLRNLRPNTVATERLRAALARKLGTSVERLADDPRMRYIPELVGDVVQFEEGDQW